MIATAELAHKGDETHFNSESLRIMGQRYAQGFLRQYQEISKSGISLESAP